MAKLIMMRGLPGSGKSTRAAEIVRESGNFYRLNSDLLREMLHHDKWTPMNEKITGLALKAIAQKLLSQDKNIIIDNLNLGQQHRDLWEGVAKEHRASFEIVDMTNVPIDECIRRDSLREGKKQVGSHVIIGNAMKYKLIHWNEIVICDLDGTLCNTEKRVHYVKQQPKDWYSFYGGIIDDPAHIDIAHKIRGHWQVEGRVVVYVSGRPDSYREVSQRWLTMHSIPWIVILMRRSYDHRPDYIVKKEIYDHYLKHYNVIQVYDDRPSVIRMWREQGLNVEDCGDGNEF